MTGALKQDLAGAHGLMAGVLRGGGSLVDEYPLVFRDGFPGQVVALSEEGRVRSACAVLARELRIGSAALRAGLIGSVSTDPEHRHRGHATRVLAQAEEALRDQGCSLALLWADDPDFYFARGYRPVGSELDFALDAPAARALPEAPGLRAAEPADAAAVHALYSAHLERVARTPEETAALLGCPGMRTLVQDLGAGPRAYACMGRGEDLPAVVHEWGGDLGGVLGLVRAQAEAEGVGGEVEQVFVMAPERRADLRFALVEAGASCATGVLGLGKLLGWEAPAALLREATGAAAEVTGDGPQRRVRVRAERGARDFDEAELLSLLVPPRGDRAALAAASREIGLRTTELPLPVYVWGLDSI